MSGCTSTTNFYRQNGNGEVETMVPPSGSKKWRWSRSRKASVSIMMDKGVIQYTTVRDEFGEEAVDEMIREIFVYQPLPSLANSTIEDSFGYPILTAPSQAQL